jgi:hypothetical protein
MGKGAKIALGCGCLVLLAGAAVVGVFGVGAFWAKSKVGELTGGLDKLASKSRELESWEKKANANAYTAPADGVIAEDRFLKFLETRKRVFAVYQQYEPQFKALEAKSKGAGETPSLTDAVTGVGKVAELFSEVRLTQMKALAELGMNEQEYRDIQLAVYKSAWASESQKHSGKMPSETLAEAGQQMQEAMRQGLAQARKQGVPGTALSEEQQQKLQQGMGELGAAAKALDAPKANVELFRKYEADIKKYAMSGLEMIGM